MTPSRPRAPLAVPLLLALVACQPAGPVPTGSAALALSVLPPGARCLTLSATGPTAAFRAWSIAPGSPTTLVLSDLVPGSYWFSAAVYVVACAELAGALPTWTSRQVGAEVTRGPPVMVRLLLEANPAAPTTGGAVVVLDFASGSPAAVVSEPVVGPLVRSPVGIASGPDGRLWVADSAGFILRVDPSLEVVAFPVPDPTGQPYAITAGSDGNLWFTLIAPDHPGIGRVTPLGEITLYPLDAGAVALSIITGSDGALWFPLDSVDTYAGSIARLMPDGGPLQEFPLPPGGSPVGLCMGGDGALWYGDSGRSTVGRLGLDGRLLGEFPIPGPAALPLSLTLTSTGLVAFADGWNGRLGLVSPDGGIQLVPTPTSDGYLSSVTTGPDGKLWYLQRLGGQVGVWAPGEVPREVPVPFVGGQPVTITPGPDGALWFTDPASHRVGRVDVAGG